MGRFGVATFGVHPLPLVQLFDMKLLIVLSIIAYGYAEKLDRAYLPPVNAGTAGGSPGALIAPGLSSSQPGSSSGQPGSAFGQGFPFGGQPGSGLSRPTYGGVSGSAQNGPGFGSGINQGPGGINQVTSGINQYQSGTGSNALAPGGSGKTPSLGANAPSGTSQGAFGSTPVAGTFNVGAQQTYKVQGGGSSDQGFGQGVQGYNVPQAQVYKSDRPQAQTDRNAEILKYVNENNGESYLYSYETSNGISAEESGVATNGVKAQGGFSYTGDDGQAYSLTYTADEYGFQPQGEHLPTPHPIPEEILKSIEENARAAAAGTQEGAYRPEEYESEGSPQQYNVGQTSYNRPQGQSQGSIKGSFSQGPQAQSNQFSVNQGTYGPTGQLGQTAQTKPNQGSNQFATGPSGPQGQIRQYQQGSGSNQGPDSQFGQSGQIGQVRPSLGLSQFATGQGRPQGQSGQYQTGLGRNQGSFAQAPGQGSIAQGLGQTSQSQSSSGYNYNQPKNSFGSYTQFGSSESGQNRPQANQGQVTTTFGSQNGQGPFGVQSGKLSPSETPFGNSQFGLGQTQNLNRPGNQPTGSAGSFGLGQNQLSGNKPFGSSQGSIRPGTEGSSGPTSSGSSGYKYEVNANRPTFGNRPTGISSQPTQGSQYQPSANQPSFGTNNLIKGSSQFGGGNTVPNGQIGQAQQNGNRPFDGSTLTNQGSSPFGGSSGIKNLGTESVFGQANKPSFGSSVGPSQASSQFGLGNQKSTLAQGPSGQKGSLPVQAPYQYDKPRQSFSTQQRPGSSSFSGVDGPSSGSQGVNTQRPGGSFKGSQGVIGQSPGYTGSQGANGRPGYTGSQDVNGRPDGNSPGSQGVTGQSPGYNGSQGANGRPGYAGTQGVGGQRPGSTTSGSQSVNAKYPGSPGLSGPSQGNPGRPEQFGGPRQPPSFSPQEGYKY